MSAYKIVTISNRRPHEWYYLLDQYFKSLEGHEKIVIQGGGDYGNWGGLASKPKWLRKAIKEGAIDSEYLIFTDSWDLVFATNPDEVMTRFHSFGTDIVISCEKNCFPVETKEAFDELGAPTDYKYLNSGFIIGKTDAILTCLESMDLDNVPDDHFDPGTGKNVHPNDQELWQLCYLKQPVSMTLDFYQSICQTLHGANIDDLDFSEGRIRNKVTGSYPCSFHFNGGSKDKLEIRNPILTHLCLL